MNDPQLTCFIAMPLTTPVDAIASYGGDSEHFLHVLEHLMVPAVTMAGYRAVRPVMTGADLIQAEIIRNLETADLVLVDISRHNPNVFFELGIRTSLDRPVALVRDSLTDRLPFDTGILNTHTYDASLAPWTLASQVELLAEHLEKSAERSEGTNPLWRYFGLTKRGGPASPEGDPTQAKLDIVLQELSGLQRGLTNSVAPSGGRPVPVSRSMVPPTYPDEYEAMRERVATFLKRAQSAGLEIDSYTITPPNGIYMTVPVPQDEAIATAGMIARELGLEATFVYRP